jgi:hypothetical protein
MKRLRLMVVVLSVFVYRFAMADPNNRPSAPVTVVNTKFNPVPDIVQNGEYFNHWFFTDQTVGRNTVFTVPEGQQLIITDIVVDWWSGKRNADKRISFALESDILGSAGWETKVRFSVNYLTPIHSSFTTGLVFDEGKPVVVFISLSPYSAFPARQLDVTLTGRLVSK